MSNEELLSKSKSEYKVFSGDDENTHLFFVVLVGIRCESPFVQSSDVMQYRNRGFFQSVLSPAYKTL